VTDIRANYVNLIAKNAFGKQVNASRVQITIPEVRDKCVSLPMLRGERYKNQLKTKPEGKNIRECKNTRTSRGGQNSSE
jgi:hypothetical protein